MKRWLLGVVLVLSVSVGAMNASAAVLVLDSAVRVNSTVARESAHWNPQAGARSLLPG